MALGSVLVMSHRWCLDSKGRPSWDASFSFLMVLAAEDESVFASVETFSYEVVASCRLPPGDIRDQMVKAEEFFLEWADGVAESLRGKP